MITNFLKSIFGYNEVSNGCTHDYGYLVMKVHDESPAYLAGIQPYFDFIVQINDVSMTHEPSSLVDTLKNSPEPQFNIILYNIKMRSYRTLVIRKNSKWTGESVLGVDVHYSRIIDSETHVFHVLEVYYGSPADVAGLRPYNDYIIASDAVFDGENSFYDLIDSNEKNSVKLIVYNSETDATREVIVVPNRQWKSETKTVENDSLLGCGIGYGLIHRIPHMPIPANFSEEIIPNTHVPPLNYDSIQPFPQEEAAVNLSPTLNYVPDTQPFDSTMYKYSQSNYTTDYPQSYPQQYYYPDNYEIVPNPYHQYQHTAPDVSQADYPVFTQASYHPSDQI